MRPRPADCDPHPDPFAELRPVRMQRPLQLLGGRFQFESDSAELLQLVDWAYAGLPDHTLPPRSPRFRVRLVLNGAAPARRSRRQPAALTLMGGAGFLGGVAADSSFVTMAPAQRAALVVVSREMLGSAYHARYELLEFAVFTLAARAQQLMPLHAACVSVDDRGALLMGPSGAGKTTTALHCLLRQMEFVAEDAVFVRPADLRATGIANFLHVRPQTLRWLSRCDAGPIRAAPRIRRRSGVQKYELDLRRPDYRLAASPPRLAAAVFLSPATAGRNLLRRLPDAQVRARLAATQPYAAGQPRWHRFASNIEAVGGYELRRGRHPQQGAEALHELLDAAG